MTIFLKHLTGIILILLESRENSNVRPTWLWGVFHMVILALMENNRFLHFPLLWIVLDFFFLVKLKFTP